MQLFDSHCHLDHTYLSADREPVVERVHSAGVAHCTTSPLIMKLSTGHWTWGCT